MSGALSPPFTDPHRPLPPTLSPKLLCIQKSVTFSNICASPAKLQMERGSSLIYFKLELTGDNEQT